MGDFVCKWGRITRYDCGNIVSRTGIGQGPGTSSLDYTFIIVDDGSNDLAEGGDSGGPWYEGNYAVGIMHGENGTNAFYMAIDYVEAKGLTVRTICNDQQC